MYLFYTTYYTMCFIFNVNFVFKLKERYLSLFLDFYGHKKGKYLMDAVKENRKFENCSFNIRITINLLLVHLFQFYTPFNAQD